MRNRLADEEQAFPPPRHAALDDIAPRHRLARKAVSRAVEWTQPERQQNVSAPMATDTADAPGE